MMAEQPLHGKKFCVVMRHEKSIAATGLNITVVENDNLGFPKPSDKADAVRTGVSKLGPAILDAVL